MKTKKAVQKQYFLKVGVFSISLFRIGLRKVSLRISVEWGY